MDYDQGLEAAWVFHTIKDTDYIVTCDKYSEDYVQAFSNEGIEKLLKLLKQEQKRRKQNVDSV
jgi:hypothetical protein